jgi:hypothetical protein
VEGLGTIVQDLATGEAVDGGKVIKPSEKKNDEKALTATEIQQLNALQQASRDLDALEQRFSSYGDADWGGPVSGRAKALVGMGTNPRIAEIENLVTAATPNLARGVFREVGVLTDADVERYKKLLPNANDTAEIRAKKVADLRARMKATTEETLATLKAAGRDVADLQTKISGNAESPAQAGTIPEFASPGQVEEALASGALQRGAVVRVGGKLFRAQ